MTRKPTKRKAKQKLESLEADATPNEADAPDTRKVTFRHVRVDLPPEGRVGDADGDESGERHTTPDDEVVDAELADYDVPTEVRTHYRFNPKTGRYDLPLEGTLGDPTD